MRRGLQRALQLGRAAAQRSRSARLIGKHVKEGGVDRTAWVLDYIEERMGARRSRAVGLPVDSDSNPIPWMTYPAIEHLLDYDLSACSVFEYGSGNGSRFWAARCRDVVSVERDRNWYLAALRSSAGNQQTLLRETPLEYANAIHERTGACYDVIVIDGSYRYDCAVEALRNLADGGMVILDNSDWYENTCTLLRSADLLEVDFKGLGPLNSYAWCTSIFFHRNFRIPRRAPESALAVVGGIVQQSDGDRSHIPIDQRETHAPTH